VVTYVNAGDHILAKGMNSVSDFMWQARFCMRGTDAASVTCATALKCSNGADTVEVYALKKEVHIYIGGKRVLDDGKQQYKGVGMEWHVKENAFLFKCNEGSAIFVKVNSGAKGVKYLDVNAKLAERLFKNVNGLLGQWNLEVEDDVSFSDGTIWNPHHGLDYVSGVEHPSIADVQSSWLVQSDQSLFSLDPPASEAEFYVGTSFLGNSHTRKVLSVTSKDRELARDVCRGLGLTGPWPRSLFATDNAVFLATGAATPYMYVPI